MTERTARVDQLLQEEISRIVMREVHDPRIGFATVTRVETSPDLRHAKVWVSIIGQPDERRTTFRSLARAMPFVRHELGVLRLRRIPELHLELDDSVERGARLLQILDDLEAGREPAPPPPGETLPTPRPAHLDDVDTGPPDAATPGTDAAGTERVRRRPRVPRPSRGRRS
jgi:ribosome-binding factor A